MKAVQKWAAAVLTLLLLLSLAACGGKSEEENVVSPAGGAPVEDAAPEASKTPEEPVDATPLRVAALKGPTAMGLVRLMKDSEGGGDIFTLAGSADEVTPLLVKGELDAACVPANLGAVLYSQTEGEIVTLAVNTLGVLYIVENGETIQSMEDLKGATIVSAGKGSTPEFALRYLLEENGVNPDTDVTIDWKSEHAECVAALAAGTASIAMLPQPFVTVAQTKLEGLRTALDLTEEWEALDNGSALLTGVIVARRAFVEEHSQAVERFLEDYAASVNWVNANPADAAALIGEYGIVEAAVAEKALPHCNIVCLTGEEMKEKLSGYVQVLFDAAPQSVGGSLPGDDFYHGA